MKRLGYWLAVVALVAICPMLWGQDTVAQPGGALGSVANLGQIVRERGVPASAGSSPFTNGLGQIGSGWSQQATQGQPLSDRIHWLQRMRPEEVADRTSWMEQ